MSTLGTFTILFWLTYYMKTSDAYNNIYNYDRVYTVVVCDCVVMIVVCGLIASSAVVCVVIVVAWKRSAHESSS